MRPWIFGSTRGQSARVAGALGLPFVASYHITPATALEAIEAYRETFVPSAALSRPYVVVSADIVVADDSATAQRLAAGYGHWVYSIRTGVGAMPYPDPSDCRAADRGAAGCRKRPDRNTIRRQPGRGRASG